MKIFPVVLAIFLFSLVLVGAQNTTENDTIAPPEPQIVCSQNQCDDDCVKCSDRQCHEPGFRCVEEITMERFFPAEVHTGINQLNIVLENTGNVKLDDVYATVTGDGIETIEHIGLQKFNAGDRDYVFAKINATKAGEMDIVIRLYVSGNVKYKLVDQIKILEIPKAEVPEEKVNVTQLANLLDSLRQRYNTIENEYQDKKLQGYPVELIYDKLREAYGKLTDAQSLLFEKEYKKAELNMGLLQSNLNDLELQLNNLRRGEESLTDKIKNNLLFFGSLAAALISILTAYRLVQEKVNREKILALHQRLSNIKKKPTKKAKKKKEVGNI